jgi:hypothetical protein
MADATVTIDGLKPFEILLNIPTQITLDQKAISLDHSNNTIDLLVGQIFGPKITRNLSFLDHLTGAGGANSVYVTQAELSLLFTRDINA